MGWHMGIGLLLCLPHRAGVPSLYNPKSGMWAQLAKYQAHEMFFAFSLSAQKEVYYSDYPSLMDRRLLGDWRDSLAVKSIYCSCRGTGFTSQYHNYQ